VSRPRSIRRIAGLALVLAGLGTAAAGAPIASEEAVAVVAPEPVVPQQLLAPAEDPPREDASLAMAPGTAQAAGVQAGQAGRSPADDALAAFLRAVLAGPEATEVLAMVSAGFRDNGGAPLGGIMLVASCDARDVCGLATLPDLRLLAMETGSRSPMALVRAAAAQPADPLDLGQAYSWREGGGSWGGTAPAGGGAGAQRAEPPTLRRLVLEVLAIFGLDEVARTLWAMPLPLLLLMLAPVLVGMVAVGRWMPGRHAP